MRFHLLFIILFFVHFSRGQIFVFDYWNVGLGSNASWFAGEEEKDCRAGLKVSIRDTILTFSICERNGESMYDSLLGDTIWIIERQFHKTNFRQSSIDSIISYLDTLKGKYVFRTNPHIMSGGIYNFYIQYDNWCTEFALKNTFDSTAMKITEIVNSYLDQPHHIPVPSSRWKSDLNSKHRLHPLIKECPREPERTYKDVLEDEFDAIRQRK